MTHQIITFRTITQTIATYLFLFLILLFVYLFLKGRLHD
jgi:hypothetical protein